LREITRNTAALLLIIASTIANADDLRGFYAGAGAGYLQASEQDLQPAPTVGSSMAAFAGYRFNALFDLEGFYANIDPGALLAERSGNMYTQSFLGSGLANDATSAVAGLSFVTTLAERSKVRPFARAGVHHYNLEDAGGKPMRGESLLFGAGANISLSRGWEARLEWERYSDVDSLDRDIFSAKFEFKF